MNLLVLAIAIAVVAAVATGVAIKLGVRLHRRAQRAEANAARLHLELTAERHAASHDPLTKLPNRRAFYKLGDALLRDPPPNLVGVVLDLNGFKDINDTLGHAAGDEVLVRVAERLSLFAGDNLVARLGGDEFAGLLVLPRVDRRPPYSAATRLAKAIAEPILVGGNFLVVTTSIGMAPVSGRIDLSDVLSRADRAMYRAKSSRSGIACFDPIRDDDTVIRAPERPTVRTRDLTPGGPDIPAMANGPISATATTPRPRLRPRPYVLRPHRNAPHTPAP